MDPLVSIITVNYNQTQVTEEFLLSIQKISYPNYELFVVDNASPTQGVGSLIPKFPEFRFIESKENLGFSGGNNLAVKEAKGKYLLFINNDTEVEPDFLQPLVRLMESDPKIGMASPKIRYFFEDNLVQYAGSTEMNSYTARSFFIGEKQEDDGRFDTTMKTAFIHGAAMLVSAGAMEKVGLMEDQFFLYYEEFDWCARFKKAGFEIWYVADSLVKHKESIATGKNSPLKVYYQTRNRIFYVRRNFTGSQKLVFTLFFTIFSIPKNTVKFVINQRFDHLKAFYRGIFWNFKH